MDVKTEIKRYMENEIDLSHENLKAAEGELINAMEQLIKMVQGYNIDMSHFEEQTTQYNRILRQLEAARNAYMFNELKGITARIELLTEELKKIMKTFRVRHRRLIEEAAAAQSAEDGSEDEAEDEAEEDEDDE
ncbi:unnamed protein product [Caenorhabditis brenneri]